MNSRTGEVRCWVSSQPPAVPLPEDDAHLIKRRWLGVRRFAASRSNAAQREKAASHV